MPNLNSVTIIGHLGKKPDIKTVNTSKGEMGLMDFSVAIKSKFGEREVTDWVRVKKWKPHASLEQLNQGDAVMIQGRIKTRSYESTKTGGKVYDTYVEADVVAPVPWTRTERKDEAPVQAAQPQFAMEITDDDVPF